MREFLVEITTTVPEGTGQREVDRRRAAEAVRARELAATGKLARLWRPVGELRSIGVWRAAAEEELHAKVLGTLPLRLWMALTVTPLEPHPNAPPSPRCCTTATTGRCCRPPSWSWRRPRPPACCGSAFRTTWSFRGTRSPSSSENRPRTPGPPRPAPEHAPPYPAD
jgi:muconolactone D-isomerase